MNHIKKLTQKIKLTFKNLKQRWTILKFLLKILVLHKLPFGKKKMTMPSEQLGPVFNELEKFLSANFKGPLDTKKNQENQSYLNEFIVPDGANNSNFNLMTESHCDQQEKTTFADQISSLIHGIGLHNTEEKIQIKFSDILEEELSNYTPRTAFKGYSASVHILSTQAERLEHQIDQLKSCYEIN